MKNTRLTIVVLDYMKAPRVLKNIEFLLKQAVDFAFKIIVIDNSCNEENSNLLKEKLKGNKNIELVINSRNLGYIKAHNEVKDRIEGDYLLILNPDILLKEKNVLQKMVDFLDKNKDIGLIGPKQVNDNGEIAMSVRGWPKFYLQVARRTFLRNLPFLKQQVEQDEMLHLDYDEVQDVDWLQSSCVMLRKKLWDDIGGLEESYFLFMADPELCYQVWKRGFRVVYYPEVKVFADGKRVSAGGFKAFFKNWVLRQHVKDSLTYRFKHFLKANPRKKYYENNSN